MPSISTPPPGVVTPKQAKSQNYDSTPHYELFSTLGTSHREEKVVPIPEWKKMIRAIIDTWSYEIFFAFLTATCLGQFMIALINMPAAWEVKARWWVSCFMVTNTFFLIDFVLQILAYGPLWVFKKKVEYLLEVIM